MKSFTLFLLSASLAVTGFAGPAPEANPVPPAPTIVNIPTPAADLAAGYAEAIRQMSLKSVTIHMKSDQKVIAIKGIRTAQALKGVLLLVFSAGDMMAVNAESIVMITDGNRVP
ncbi:MAG: hypothetical protein JNG83_09630 [Opitutaceae bacterium]|nr:hypothetical protein [Opitutaceae bacterium]